MILRHFRPEIAVADADMAGYLMGMPQSCEADRQVSGDHENQPNLIDLGASALTAMRHYADDQPAS